MASLPIPSPPPTPNGDLWVENWRGTDEVQYFSEDGSASIWLQLVSDSDGPRWEWTSHEVIVGLDLRALAEEWEQSRTDGLSGIKPVSEPAPAPVREAGWYFGRAAAEQEPEPEPVSEPVPVSAPEPAPNTLYSGVPVDERRAFARWLNG